MFSHSIKRTILWFTLVGAVAGAALHVAPASAQVTGPMSLLAVTDDAVYGVMIVSGQNFTPNTTAALQVRDSANGTVLLSASAGVGRDGSFRKMVSLSVPCATQAAGQVTLRATDASQAVSGDLVVALGTPMGLAMTQLAAAQSALTSLLKSTPSPLNSATLLAWEQQVVIVQADVIADQARVIAGQTAQPSGAAC